MYRPRYIGRSVPVARNGEHNGCTAGSPACVHGGGVYKHRICGNELGVPQFYNKVGKVQETHTSGSKAEFKVVLAAHHVVYF